MKLTESKLRSIIREELQRLNEMGGENLHDLSGMNPTSFLTAVADRLSRETGRDASAVPAGRDAGMGDNSEDSTIIFEGMNQNLFISLEATRGGVSGHIRTSRGDLLRSFDTGQADPDAVAARAASALRDVGEL